MDACKGGIILFQHDQTNKAKRNEQEEMFKKREKGNGMVLTEMTIFLFSQESERTKCTREDRNIAADRPNRKFGGHMVRKLRVSLGNAIMEEKIYSAGFAAVRRGKIRIRGNYL